MRINIAALGSRVHTGWTDVEAPNLPWDDILVICLPRHCDITELDDQWQRLPAELTDHAQVAVFRVHPGDESDFLPRNGLIAPGLDVLRRRARIPIYLATWREGKHALSVASIPDDPAELSDETVDSLLLQIGRAELIVYASSPRARLPQNKSFHYVGPNGQHYRSFLRVQSILQLPDQLDAVSFWLLPHVEPDTVVMLDSSTITVVGLHLGQYIRETGLSSERDVKLVQPMRGYDEEVQELLQRRVEAAIPNRGDRHHALILVSVVGSGGLALKARTFAERLQFDQISSVGIYGAGGEEDALTHGRLDVILAQLKDDLGRVEAKDCPDCAQKRRGQSAALHLGRDSYQVQISHPVATVLTVPAMQAAIDVMKRYPGSGAFSAHRSEPNWGLSRRPRHHAIYVDVAMMLSAKDGVFADRLDAKVRSLETKFDAILTPEHNAAVALGARVQSTLSVPLISRNAEEFAQLSRTERLLLDRGRVLIVDDAIITGSRLRGYRMSFLDHELAPADVHMVAGLCRVTSGEKRVAIANLVHQLGERETNFHPVEEFLLPDLHEKDCPWCWERDLLFSYGRKGEELHNWLIERADDLGENGLTTNLFHGWTRDEFPLGPGSALGSESLTQAQIFTIVASALQTLRSEGKLDEEFTPPIAKVLEPAFWADGRFYAEPITASILRAANAHDLVAPIAGREFGDAVQRRWEEAPSRNLRGELLLATMGGKLPVLDGTFEAVTDPLVDSAFVGFFSSHLPEYDENDSEA